MSRVLLTAFEPYDRWSENSSWLALMDLTNWYEGATEIVTRRYPVDLSRMSDALRKDLQSDFDFAIHVGQSPGSPIIKVEAVGLNVRSDGSPLINGAPDAYRSPLPLAAQVSTLVNAGIPCELSHHAGTYLCNAALYLSQHYAKSFGMKTRAAFVHLPLAPSQSAKAIESRLPSMSTAMSSAAIALLVDELTNSVA
ncbi:pyroglutamyl-peptidase I [Rubripirellula amarantea]|uniref:Pyrrolidone-carboxylate peptidase n=1 Tax=Rubripirellula amarantea TaxID=2527999 RepID=A0A5C5WES2_9BACT|nr:pyroglutamyl-peptidase I [Rubripirellula amarantea]MDA8743163.1 pyroglutamyl-peptidase I [Rubripirellula amarantea]TWT49426.1 Pyrrolidone-carboxylate peptidase [Rubripirellula amarantea]